MLTHIPAGEFLLEENTPGNKISKIHVDASKNRGIFPPKWMVKIMENPIRMDDLGVPLFLGNTRVDGSEIRRSPPGRH